MSQTASVRLAADAAVSLTKLQTMAPKVHCLTNDAARGLTANLLLAVGATPSLTRSPEEVADFVASSQALVVNLGTPDGFGDRPADVGIAAAAANRVPWVLDPVMVERSHVRLETAKRFLARNPAVVRGNAGEIGALGLAAEAEGGDGPPTVVALTGAVDVVLGRQPAIRIANGHPWMSRVTALGCGGSALIAAFLAVEADAFAASCQALLVAGVAGEVAAEQARGPGSFAVAFLDVLHALDDDTLTARARVLVETGEIDE